MPRLRTVDLTNAPVTRIWIWRAGDAVCQGSWSELAEIHQHAGGTWQDCPSCSGCDVHRETGPGATRAMDAYRAAWLAILERQNPGKVLRASVQQPRTSPAGERLARSGSMQGVPVGLLASWGGRAQNRNA